MMISHAIRMTEYIVCINQNQLAHTRNAVKTILIQLFRLSNNGFVKEWNVIQQRYCHSNPVNFGIVAACKESSVR